MKKIVNFLMGISMAAVLFSACTDYLDINKDPSFPATASTQLLFASGTTWSGAVLGSDVQLVGSYWAQHYAQNNTSQQYTTIDQYNLAYNNNYFARYWSSVYAGALPDLKRVISQSETEGLWNYWVAAKIMTAFDFNMLVSLYEKVPFKEALMGDANLTPVFDESKSIDAGIITMLNEAIAKSTEAAALPTMGTKDMVFGGDIAKWVSFAKSIKLKILMRDFTTNQTAIQTLLTEDNLLASDAKMAQFTDAENKSNPLFENDRRKLNTTTNIRVSATLVAYLKANNDTRIGIFCEPCTQILDPVTDKLVSVPANQSPFYRGIDQGVYGNATFSSNVFPTTVHSRAVLAATDPVYFMSEVECNFMKAEAWARIGNIANAKTAYDAAVKGSFTRWAKDGAPFVAVGGAYEFKSANLDAMLKSIITQKWVSSVRTDSWNAFLDINRTGIPALGTQTVTDLARISQYNANYVVGTLTPSVTSVLLSGQFPKRFLFPKTSADYNPNTPKVVPIYEKMWWSK